MSEEFNVQVPGESPDAAAPAPVVQTAPDAPAPGRPTPRKVRAAAAPAPAADAPAGAGEDAPPDGIEARIATLELQLAQSNAALAEIAEENANLKAALELRPAAGADQAPPVPPRAVGATFDGTAAEALAAGIRTVVLCSDGYHVPPPLPVDIRA